MVLSVCLVSSLSGEDPTPCSDICLVSSLPREDPAPCSGVCLVSSLPREDPAPCSAFRCQCDFTFITPWRGSFITFRCWLISWCCLSSSITTWRGSYTMFRCTVSVCLICKWNSTSTGFFQRYVPHFPLSCRG